MKLNEKSVEKAIVAAYKSGTIRRGFKFMQIVCLIFIVAKISQLVVFSWWWVFAPIWLPPALILGAIISVAIVIAVGVLIVYLVCLLLDKISAAKKARARKKLQTKVLGDGNSKGQ